MHFCCCYIHAEEEANTTYLLSAASAFPTCCCPVPSYQHLQSLHACTWSMYARRPWLYAWYWLRLGAGLGEHLRVLQRAWLLDMIYHRTAAPTLLGRTGQNLRAGTGNAHPVKLLFATSARLLPFQPDLRPTHGGPSKGPHQTPGRRCKALRRALGASAQP